MEKIKGRLINSKNNSDFRFAAAFPWKLMFWQLSVSHHGRTVLSSSCSSRWPLSLNFLFVFWKCRLFSDQWRQRGPVALQQRLVGDLPRIPEGRVPPSAGIQRLIYWSLYGRWLFLAGGCCCCRLAPGFRQDGDEESTKWNSRAGTFYFCYFSFWSRASQRLVSTSPLMSSEFPPD